MLVFTNRLWQIELKNVVLHELGHVLGLGHNDKSRLMSSRYFGDHQHRIDQVTAEMVSHRLAIPLSNLNWFVGPHKSAALY